MSKQLRVTGYLIAAATAAAAVALPASAVAAPTPAPAHVTDHYAPRAVTHRVSTPEGVLVYGWRPLTKSSLAQPVPDSASGCDLDVCISITGTGTYVSDWNTTAYWDGGYICTHSNWYINDVLVRTGNGACGGAGVFFSDWQPNRHWPSPSLACNSWQTIPGRPCETIES